jgi:hypothetical protein
MFAVQRIIKDNSAWVAHDYGRDGVERERLTKRDAVETARDWKLWVLLFCNICASVPSQAFSVFMPIVVQGLGYSSLDANLVCGNDLFESGCALVVTRKRRRRRRRRRRLMPCLIRCPYPPSSAAQPVSTSSPSPQTTAKNAATTS